MDDCAKTREATQRWRGTRVRILETGCLEHAGHLGTVERASVLGNQTLIIVKLDKPGSDDPPDWEVCTVFPDYVEVL